MIQHPIRILHVVTSMGLGGIETFLMSLYKCIDREKIQFDFLYHTNKKSAFDDEILSLGGKIFRVEPILIYNILGYKKKVASILKQHNYQVVHSHLNTKSSVVLHVAKQCNIPIRIAHSHTNSSGKGLENIIKNFFKLKINKYNTHRLACSKEAGEWLFGKNMDFKIIKNSIDSKRFLYNEEIRSNLRADLHIKDDTIVIGNIARFSEEKNHIFIVDVFKKFNEKCPNSLLLLIGAGHLMEQVKEQVSILNLKNNVIFLGQKLNANEYLSCMDLFLFPSLFEGLGIVAIEAQVNGLPVLISENLPKELDITGLIYRMNLSTQPQVWAEQLLKMKRKEGLPSYNEIKKSGYDIYESANVLTEFYITNLKS